MILTDKELFEVNKKYCYQAQVAEISKLFGGATVTLLRELNPKLTITLDSSNHACVKDVLMFLIHSRNSMYIKSFVVTNDGMELVFADETAYIHWYVTLNTSKDSPLPWAITI